MNGIRMTRIMIMPEEETDSEDIGQELNSDSIIM